MKIRHKIILIFTLLVTGIISLMAVSIYYFSALERRNVFNTRLKSRANYSAQVYSLFGDSSSIVLDRVDSVSASGFLPERNISVFSAGGKILYQFEAPNSDPLVVNDDIFQKTALRDEVYFKIDKRDAMALRHRGGNKEFIVVVAAFDKDGLDRMNALSNILLVSLLAAIILTIWTGSLFSNKLLKPIKQIIYEVNDISSYNLSNRLPTGPGKDELNQLANTFNELLERLYKSFEIQKRFISNASHELSTPLTSISSQLEVTLQNERTNLEYKIVLASINEDVFKMRQLTKSLLEIAKADMHGNIELAEVRVDEILMQITSEIKTIESSYQVDLYFDDFPDEEKACVVFGNIELLQSAIKNIVENGCKYSPDHCSQVKLSFSNQQVLITVKNEGNVIATEEIQKIFQPFYRGSNTREQNGFGLGLSLAKTIIRIHKGTIEVTSSMSKGTVFEIHLPSLQSFQTEI
jgi:two-component system, OmpR family, sensor histidine kinase ArlS